ncbi:exu [Trypoxylus dichotomus]
MSYWIAFKIHSKRIVLLIVISTKNVKGIEEGRYRLVGWAVDTTGRRLIDEICQIAGYTPDSKFSQYIMPFSDIRLIYRRRHSIRVINMGRYRMLKDLRTNKFVKTKSEISALTDFIVWLEQVKAMLLESFRRHGLSERFAKVVKGFANCYDISQDKCANTTKSYTLRTMSKVLLNKEEDISSAATRAQTCYEIVVHLGQGEIQDLDSKGSGDCKGNEVHLINLVRPYTNPVSEEEQEIAQFKVLLERQNTFKPVFGALLRATPLERQHASHLRRILAENNIDYDKLKNAFETGAKEGLEKVLTAEISNAKEEDLIELLEILDCFFDPEKKPVQPKPRYFQNNRKGLRRNKENRDRNANMTKPEPLPETNEIKMEIKPDIKTEIKTESAEPSSVTEAAVNNMSSATA